MASEGATIKKDKTSFHVLLIGRLRKLFFSQVGVHTETPDHSPRESISVHLPSRKLNLPTAKLVGDEGYLVDDVSCRIFSISSRDQVGSDRTRKMTVLKDLHEKRISLHLGNKFTNENILFFLHSLVPGKVTQDIC